ncbi:MAG: hypothetical protein ACLUOI_37815 [Eisenbergiella sp.]
MTRILSCGFVGDTRICFLEFYDEVTQALGEHSADEGIPLKFPLPSIRIPTIWRISG